MKFRDYLQNEINVKSAAIQALNVEPITVEACFRAAILLQEVSGLYQMLAIMVVAAIGEEEIRE